MNTAFRLFPHHHKWFSENVYVQGGTIVGVGRLLNTVYRNTFLKPLIVIGGCETSSGSMTILSDSSPTPTTTILQGHGFGNQWFPFTIIVPPGNYYEIVGTSGCSLQFEVEFTINGSPVGFSGELSGSRAVGGVYQNTTSKAKLIVANIGASSNTTISLICDSSPSPTTIVGDSVMSNGSAYQFPMVMMVPQGYYYQITGAASVSNWNEYTLPFGATQSLDLGPAGANTRTLSTLYTNGAKDMWITASGQTSNLGQTTVSAAGNPSPIAQTSWSTWPFADAMSWAIAQPNDIYVQTVGSPQTLTHWFEYVLG
jgi:hypothetical protein